MYVNTCNIEKKKSKLQCDVSPEFCRSEFCGADVQTPTHHLLLQENIMLCVLHIWEHCSILTHLVRIA